MGDRVGGLLIIQDEEKMAQGVGAFNMVPKDYKALKLEGAFGDMKYPPSIGEFCL